MATLVHVLTMLVTMDHLVFHEILYYKELPGIHLFKQEYYYNVLVYVARTY